MRMTLSNTIRPNGEHPQVHIIVKSNAPRTSAIAKMYRQGVKKGKPEDITGESWVTAIQIYNVFTAFPEILETLNDQMRCNIERCATLIRGKLRHNGGQGVMFGVGEIRDQHGNVGPSSSSNPQVVSDFGKGRSDCMRARAILIESIRWSRPILLAPLVSSALRIN